MATNVSNFTPFSAAQTRGLIVVPVFALLSALALVFIVYRCIRFVVIPSFQRNPTTSRAPENMFFRTHLGHYAASLIMSNAFLTAAGLMEFFWVTHSGIPQGHLCNSQAVLMQFGSWTTCFFSVAIGIHTCNSLVFRLSQTNWLSVVVIAFGWIASLLIALGPLSRNDSYGPVIVSCGVTTARRMNIFGLKAFPVIVGAILSVLVYSFIYLVLRGVLHVKGGIKFTFKPQERWSELNDSEEYHSFMGAIAKSMFWYPIAFVFLLLPFTIANLTEWSGRSIPFGADIFVHACWSILGLVNVALLYNTFRVLSPIFHRATIPKIEIDTEKSFGNDAFDESPILPPVAHIPKGPLLPLFRKDGDKSLSPISPVSLSQFPGLTQHSRSLSSSSVDSTTHLLSIKRKPSKYHKMRVKQGESLLSLSHIVLPAELSRQLDEASDAGRYKLDLPMAEVNTATTTLVTVSLSPAPRSAVASLLGTSPVVPTAVQSTVAPPMRKITAAFGRPGRKSQFGPRSIGSDKSPSLPIGQPLSPVPGSPSVESPTKKWMARIRVPSLKSADKRRPSPLDLADVTPVVPVIRPLPAITAVVPVQKVDKGKGRAPPPPMTPLVEKRSHTALRPLPQFPQNSTESLSPGKRSRRPDLAASAVSLERDDSLSSLSSVSSVSSSQHSLESTYSSQTHDNSSEEEDSTDSESSSPLSFGRRRQAAQSGITTWSQESAVTTSQPLNIEAALARIALASTTVGDQMNVGMVPKKSVSSPRVQIPPALRSGKLVEKLSILKSPVWMRA